MTQKRGRLNMNNENIQKIRMCVQTYINIYGVLPSVNEMSDWLGMPGETIAESRVLQDAAAGNYIKAA